MYIGHRLCERWGRFTCSFIYCVETHNAVYADSRSLSAPYGQFIYQGFLCSIRSSSGRVCGVSPSFGASHPFRIRIWHGAGPNNTLSNLPFWPLPFLYIFRPLRFPPSTFPLFPVGGTWDSRSQSETTKALFWTSLGLGEIHPLVNPHRVSRFSLRGSGIGGSISS